MTTKATSMDVDFGFLSVVRSAEDGLFGGYLILNGQGRPLEFHCTAPVKANRAQEILYGATLESFLHGEQIGQTLMSAAKRVPQVVCTDVLSVLALQSVTSTPVVWVADRLPTMSLTAVELADVMKLVDEADCARLAKLSTVYPFAFADHVLLMNESQRAQQDEICQQLTPLLQLIELREPFTRIQAAIEEAHRNALGESQHRQAG